MLPGTAFCVYRLPQGGRLALPRAQEGRVFAQSERSSWDSVSGRPQST